MTLISRLRFLSAAALLVGVLGAGGSRIPDAETAAVRSAALGSAMDAECTYKCEMCIMYGYTNNVPGGTTHWNYGYSCAEASCPNGCQVSSLDGHGLEPLGQPTINRIQALVAGGDLEALEREIAADARIELNESRSAIQVMGCEKAVMAHIPVSPSLLNQLVHH